MIHAKKWVGHSALKRAIFTLNRDEAPNNDGMVPPINTIENDAAVVEYQIVAVKLGACLNY